MPTPFESSNGVQRGCGGVRLFSDSKNVIVVHSDSEGEEGQAAKRQSKPDLGCRKTSEQLGTSKPL